MEAALRDAFLTAEDNLKKHVESMSLHLALADVWKAIAACDKYIVETAPFKLWKDEANKERVGEILHVLFDAVRHTARLIGPFMPETAARMAALLNTDPGDLGQQPPCLGQSFADGHLLSKPEALFPRIETA